IDPRTEAELLSARRPVSLPLRYPGAASAATRSINHKGIFSFSSNVCFIHLYGGLARCPLSNEDDGRGTADEEEGVIAEPNRLSHKRPRLGESDYKGMKWGR